MQAIQFNEHGSSEVLQLVKRKQPSITAEEVLVEVKAAGLNHLDLWIRRGLPGLSIPLPHIPGSDAAGVIVEVGSQVLGWKIGDAVVIQPGTFCGNCQQCQAGREDLCPEYGILGETESGVQQQFLALRPENIGRKPTTLNFAEAAALSLSALTSWHMLNIRAQLKAGENLLVLGAGSGVGSMAVQLGKYMGAWVIATGGTVAKRALATSLGANAVLDQREPGFGSVVRELTGGKGADVVFEHIGAATWPESVKSLAFGGRLVTCGATTGIRGELNLQHLFYKRQSILGSTMGSVADFQACLTLAEQGQLKPVIDQVYPFKSVQAAHDHLEFEHDFGKVVLQDWE